MKKSNNKFIEKRIELDNTIRNYWNKIHTENIVPKNYTRQYDLRQSIIRLKLLQMNVQ